MLLQVLKEVLLHQKVQNCYNTNFMESATEALFHDTNYPYSSKILLVNVIKSSLLTLNKI